MTLVISSFNMDPVNLYLAPTTVFVHTMAEDAQVEVAIYMASIAGTSQAFTVYVEVLDGSNNSFGKVSEVFNKNDANSRFRMHFKDSLFVPSGCKVQVQVHCSDSGSTYADCTCYLLDASYASSSPTAGQIADAVWDESFGEHSGTTDGIAWTLDQLAASIFSTESTTASILEDTGTTGVVLASSSDVYHADINVAVDSANNRDEYTVTWFKNGARVTASIGSPDITVIDRASGDPLFDDDLAEIGGTGILKKDVTGTLISPGNAYVVITSALIDSATRTFSKVIGRDAVV